jgi:hypothetical protein
LIVQGLKALDVADTVKDAGISPRRGVIDFQIESSDTIKFVGWWFDVNKMRFNNPTHTIGPALLLLNFAGVQRNACLFASPYPNAKHVLAVTCERIPTLGPEPEMFMFYGGFDPADTMTDPAKEAGFLAFLYPVSETEKIRDRIGSVDYVPEL